MIEGVEGDLCPLSDVQKRGGGIFSVILLCKFNNGNFKDRSRQDPHIGKVQSLTPFPPKFGKFRTIHFMRGSKRGQGDPEPPPHLQNFNFSKLHFKITKNMPQSPPPPLWIIQFCHGQYCLKLSPQLSPSLHHTPRCKTILCA